MTKKHTSQTSQSSPVFCSLDQSCYSEWGLAKLYTNKSYSQQQHNTTPKANSARLTFITLIALSLTRHSNNLASFTRGRVQGTLIGISVPIRATNRTVLECAYRRQAHACSTMQCFDAAVLWMTALGFCTRIWFCERNNEKGNDLQCKSHCLVPMLDYQEMLSFLA